MSATTIDPHVVEGISNEVKRQISNNEDKIQHEIEKRLISDGGLKSTVTDLGLPKELGTLNPDDFEDSQDFRKELNNAVDKLRTKLYRNSDSGAVREALRELGVEVNKSRSEQSDITSKHQFNKFMEDTRGEHVMVAPGDELLFLGTIGAGIAFILFAVVVYAVDSFIGSGAAGTLVVVAAGSLLATITGLVLKKVYDIVKFIHRELV